MATEAPAESRIAGTSAGRAWAVVGFLWLAFLLNYVDRQMIFSIFPILRRDLGFTGAQLGLIGSLFLWSYCACLGPAGRLADVLRNDRLILASLLLWSAATLGTGMSHSIGAVLFWRAVMGITESLYTPAAFGLIALLHPVATRSRALAVHGTAQLLGSVAGSWYGGWSEDRFGWRNGFLLLAITGMLYAVVLAAALRGLPKFERVSRPSVTGSLREIFRSRCYVALIGAFVAFGVMLWMLYTWLPDFLYERYRLSLAESGLTATLYLQSGAAVGMLGGGSLADWLVRRVPAARFYIVATGVIGAAPLAWLTLAVDSLALVKAGAAGFGFFAGLLLTNVFAAGYDVVSRGNYGLAAGVLNSLPGFVSGTVVLLVGALRQSVGMTTMMQWGSLAALSMGMLLLAAAWRRFGRDRGRQAEMPVAPVAS